MKKEGQKTKKKKLLKGCLLAVGIIIGLFVIIIIIAYIFVDPAMSWYDLKSPTNQKEISFSGTSKSKIGKAKLYNNDQEIKEVEIKNKKFSFENIELQEGKNKLKVTIKNDEGKTKNSNDKVIILDTINPEIVLNDYSFETDQNEIVLSGKTEKNTEIKLYKNDKEINKIETKNGDFEFRNIKLDSGENKFKFVVIDKADNKNEKEIVIKLLQKEKKQEKSKQKEPKEKKLADYAVYVSGYNKTGVTEEENYYSIYYEPQDSNVQKEILSVLFTIMKYETEEKAKDILASEKQSFPIEWQKIEIQKIPIYLGYCDEIILNGVTAQRKYQNIQAGFTKGNLEFSFNTEISFRVYNSDYLQPNTNIMIRETKKVMTEIIKNMD